MPAGRAAWEAAPGPDGRIQPPATALKASATRSQATVHFRLVLGFAECRTSSSSPLVYITYKTAKGFTIRTGTGLLAKARAGGTDRSTRPSGQVAKVIKSGFSSRIAEHEGARMSTRPLMPTK